MRKQLARILGFDTKDISTEEDKQLVNAKSGESSLDQGEQPKDFGAQSHEPSEHIQAVFLSQIDVNPFQPRKIFYDHSLEELAQSIKEYGIIQPILLRKKGERYELVAGERRFRAAKLAGYDTVPAIVKDLTQRETAEIAIVENLQREDLSFMEEAEGYQVLLHTFGLTQEELAKRVGKSQSTIANKLRLLKLPENVRKEMAGELISERHARALLKLPDEPSQLSAVQTIKQKEMTVRQTEEYIEKVLSDISREISDNTPKQRIIRIFKDIRIFINTIHNVVNEMRKAGLDIKIKETADMEYIHIHLQIPKKR